MPGRGRGLISLCDTTLRRPGSADELSSPTTLKDAFDDFHDLSQPPPSPKRNPVEDLVGRIALVTSPDDLAISNLANEIRTMVLEETALSDLINKLFVRGLEKRELTPVIGAVCGLAAQHQINQTKLRSLLLTKLQNIYERREELSAADRSQFVTSVMFLGEIFYRCRSTNGSPIKVLAFPVVTCLLMVLNPHLRPEPGPDINEEMMTVAKQLLQNGCALYSFHPHELEDIVKGVTEILIRHKLSDSCRLNLLAVLSDLWPVIQSSLNARTTHATLAAKLGLALQI